MSKYTKETAEALLKELSEHYGEPVMPLHKFCDGMWKWARAMAASDGPYASVGKDAIRVFSNTSKSNLLARIFFRGEDPRKAPCPIHKGQWSGCVFGDQVCPHCMSGCNVTGWVRDS